MNDEELLARFLAAGAPRPGTTGRFLLGAFYPPLDEPFSVQCEEMILDQPDDKRETDQ